MCWNTIRWVMFAVCIAGFSSGASGYTPQDPVVKKMVDRGVAYLESVKKLNGSGEEILVAYAHHKCRHDPDNPVVKRGISAAVKMAAEIEKGKGGHEHKRNYEIAVAVLLLADVDANVYKHELQVMQESLLEEQKPHGGFGYPGEQLGDVSQTQYAILAIWTLDRSGIPLDYDRVVRCAQWMLRVQDPTGVWPYKGEDPGPNSPRKTQKKTGVSMALAGGSSLLIAGDALRLWGETEDANDPGIPGLPEAIKLYKEDKNVSRRKRATMSEAPVKVSVRMMDQWRSKNPLKYTTGLDWYYYMVYTLERYESFVEIANGLPKDSSPGWYNRVVDELRKVQGSDGGWSDRKKTTPPISTSFALMFLIRSTQKAIFTSSAGSLQGGYGLPKDTTDIRVDGTQIKGRPIEGQVQDLLKILEDDDSEGLSGGLPENLQLSDDPKERAAELDRFERLVRGSKSWQARRVAARLLSKSDELRVVPSLIFALSDPDKPVRLYARDGLRFLSRRFEGFGMSDDPSRAEVDKIQRDWRNWYRSVNPKYVFLDYDL